MKMFKRPAAVLLTAILILLVCFTAAAEDAAPDPVLSGEKDGIKAELVISWDENAPDNVSLGVKITNVSGANVSDLKVDVTLPDGFILESELLTAIPLAVGESRDVAIKLTNTHAFPETAPETEPETEPVTEEPKNEKGCKSAAISAICVVIISGAAFLISKKDKRSTLSCLMIGAMLLGSFAFAIPTEAATTRRSIELLDTVLHDGVEYPIGVTVSYDHTFTEEDREATAGMEKFEITYYFGPQGTYMNEENIKLIAEAGFTSIPLECNHGGGDAHYKDALGYMRKYGLTCSAIQCSSILHAIAIGNEGATQEEVDAIVLETVNEYAEYSDVIKGWWLADEPNARAFKGLGMVVDALKRFAPEDAAVINLFPSYASDSQLGTNGFQEYLDRFIAEVDPPYISYDHYHFKKSGSSGKDFFYDMEAVRSTSLNAGLDYMLITLLTEHMSYANLTYDQLEWEVNMCLAYGMKRVSFFTYWLDEHLLNQGWSNACADINGTIYQHYYDVQKINGWMYPLGEQLFDKTSVGVYHTKIRSHVALDDGCVEYEGYGDLGEVNAKNFVIGFFDDGSFMIANKYYRDFFDPDTNEANSINIFEFVDVDSGLEYFDTKTSTWRDAEADGVVTRNEKGNLLKAFEHSEGVLFRVAD